MPAEPVRMPLISANWKMHHNHFEAIQQVQKLSYMVSKDDLAHVEVSIHPPFTDLRSVQTVLESDHIAMALGAQNCHFEASGAFTGEVSATMLAKHPERLIEKAVYGMLPKSALGRQKLRNKLRVYADANHPHVAQQPTPLTINTSTKGTK